MTLMIERRKEDRDEAGPFSSCTTAQRREIGNLSVCCVCTHSLTHSLYYPGYSVCIIAELELGE